MKTKLLLLVLCLVHTQLMAKGLDLKNEGCQEGAGMGKITLTLNLLDPTTSKTSTLVKTAQKNKWSTPTVVMNWDPKLTVTGISAVNKDQLNLPLPTVVYYKNGGTGLLKNSSLLDEINDGDRGRPTLVFNDCGSFKQYVTY